MAAKSQPVIWTREMIREHALTLAEVTANAQRQAEQSRQQREKQFREALSPFWAWRMGR